MQYADVAGRGPMGPSPQTNAKEDEGGGTFAGVVYRERVVTSPSCVFYFLLSKNTEGTVD